MTDHRKALTRYELDNIQVWEHTKRYFKRLDDNSKNLEKSILYDIHDLPSPEIKSSEEEVMKDFDKLALNDVCKVEVRNIDSFDLAQEYISLNLKCLVLNMASDYKPGGGVSNGRTAQEEVLFRRSNAHDTHPECFYPLKSNQVVFSPKVTVIKDTSNEMLQQPFGVGMIACAGLRHPKTLGSGKTMRFRNEADRILMKRKINSIFHIAKLHGYEALVLGSLGCGAFGCPPMDVATLFKEVLQDYKQSFKYIGFAVLVVRKDTDQTNFDIFHRVITID